jgi:hypothetical protein
MPRVCIAILALCFIAASSAAEAKKPGVTCTATQLGGNAALTCAAKENHVVICLAGGMMMCCVPNGGESDSYTCSSTTWYLRRPGSNLPQLQQQSPSGAPQQR